MLRSLGISGVMALIFGVLLLSFNIGTRTLQVNSMFFGISVIVVAWGFRKDVLPPVSCVQWILVGDAPPYSEMSEARLKTHLVWISRRVYRRNRTSYRFDTAFGLTTGHAYTTEQLETAVNQCREELEVRGITVRQDDTDGLPSYSFEQAE